jgi:hypothetical protein
MGGEPEHLSPDDQVDSLLNEVRIPETVLGQSGLPGVARRGRAGFLAGFASLIIIAG